MKKTLTKDDEFKRKTWERLMDLATKRSNLKKYLKRMAKETREVVKTLDENKKKLDKQKLVLKDDKKKEELEEFKKKVKINFKNNLWIY
ncbi:unnamed protein product [Meloidogyne enterolobii]|uniref:Uncharacterized protein n=1 Tax=Meloidogyne enterolobii TaxID=390850 RepID=A0ACB0ZQ45_MELEN